jgi:hypothetical protein
MYDPTLKQGEKVVTKDEPIVEVMVKYPKACIKASEQKITQSQWYFSKTTTIIYNILKNVHKLKESCNLNIIHIQKPRCWSKK